MKVLMLIDSLVKGGRERRLLELLKSYSKRKDIEVSLVLFSNKSRVEYPEVYDLNIPIYYLERNPKKDPRVFYRFYNICKKERPDIIHSWGIMPTIYAIPSVKILGIKLINACIADAPEDMSLLDKRYFRAGLTFPFSDIIVANSNAGLEAYRVPEKKRSCIHNGFDFNRIKTINDEEKTREHYLIKPGKLVGMVGAFFDRKDYYTYLKAACKYLEKQDDTTFLAIGDGPNLDYFKSTIPKKFRDKILFLGMIHDVESVVNLLDIGVLATYTEGISNSIMEYMVLGKPVIASDGGGTKELVMDGETGLLVPQKDPNALFEKLDYLLARPELCAEMGQKGKNRIHEYFTIERMNKEYLDLYESI
jgi:glycosyltransferase involved in cell wall biosynthesis